MKDFDITDESTWPVLLSAEQIAAIWQRPVLGVKKACQLHKFIPAPFQVKPYRWRKADVLRAVDGGRGPLRLSKAS